MLLNNRYSKVFTTFVRRIGVTRDEMGSGMGKDRISLPSPFYPKFKKIQIFSIMPEILFVANWPQKVTQKIQGYLLPKNIQRLIPTKFEKFYFRFGFYI